MNSVFFFFIELCDFKTKNLYNCLFDSYFVFPLPLFRNEQMICSFIITYIKPKRVLLPPVIYLICMTISSTSLTLLRMTNIKPWVAVCLCSKQTLHMWVPISLVEVCRAWDKYERRLMYGAPWLKMWMYWFSSWFTAGLIASISCWIFACLGVRWKQNEYALNLLFHIHSYGAGELQVLRIVGPGRVGKSTLVAYILQGWKSPHHKRNLLLAVMRWNKLSACSSKQSLMVQQWLNPTDCDVCPPVGEALLMHTGTEMIFIYKRHVLLLSKMVYTANRLLLAPEKLINHPWKCIFRSSSIK